MGTYIEADADLPLVALCRRSDPPTSHEAAAKTASFSSDHRRRIVAALEAGPAGQSEIARRAGLTVAQVSKRLKELRVSGAIVRDGETVSESGGREARYRRSATDGI